MSAQVERSKEGYARRLVDFVQSSPNMTLVDEPTRAVELLADECFIGVHIHDGDSARYAEVDVYWDRFVVHDVPQYNSPGVGGLPKYRRFVDALDDAVQELRRHQPPTTSEMGLTDRTVCALEASGITNLAQLLERSAKDLMRRRGFGKKRLDDVIAVLSKYNVSLKNA